MRSHRSFGRFTGRSFRSTRSTILTAAILVSRGGASCGRHSSPCLPRYVGVADLVPLSGSAGPLHSEACVRELTCDVFRVQAHHSSSLLYAGPPGAVSSGPKPLQTALYAPRDNVSTLCIASRIASVNRPPPPLPSFPRKRESSVPLTAPLRPSKRAPLRHSRESGNPVRRAHSRHAGSP